MFCPECGAKIDEGGRFCPECGADLWAQGAQPETAAAAAAEPGAANLAEPAATDATAAVEVQPTQQVPSAEPTQVTPPAQPVQQPGYQPGQVPFMQPTQPAAQVPPQGAAQPQGQWQQPGAQQTGANQQTAGQQWGAQQAAASQQQPNQQWTAPQAPAPMAPVPQAPKGCLAQAFDDLMHTPGLMARIVQAALIPGVVAIVPVIGWVAAIILFFCLIGFAVEFGRSPARGIAFDGTQKPWSTKKCSLGFLTFSLYGFWELLSFLPGLVVQVFAIGGIAGLGAGLARRSAAVSLYGSSAYNYSNTAATAAGGLVLIVFLAMLLSFVLSIFFTMFADASVMHLAIRNRLDEGFEIKEIWSAYKRQLGKLFCASVLPTWIVAAATTIAVLLVWAVFGAMAAAMYPIAFIFILIATVLTCVGIAIAVAFWFMLKYRAVGYWAARYAPEWANGASN